MTVTATAQEVQFRSYLIWENEGRPQGCDQEHWFRAEAELAGERAAAAATPKAAAPRKRKTTAKKKPAAKKA